MKASEKDIALFDRYFQGHLSISEQHFVDDRVKSDPEYAAAFNEYREFVRQMGLAGEIWLKSEFKKIEKEVGREGLDVYTPGNQGKDYEKKARRWNIMSWVMIVGSVILLLAFLIAIFNLPDLEKKFTKHQEKETVITEEKDSTLENCSPIIPLAHEALYAHFPELKRSGQRMDQPETQSRSIMVCQRDVEEDKVAYFIDQRIKDSLILINFECDDLELFMPNDTLVGIILKCHNELYRVFENSFRAINIDNDLDSSDTVLSEADRNIEEVIDIAQ